MRRRRTRLIYRWAGVAILVVWASTFVRRVGYAWNCIAATHSGGGPVNFIDTVEFAQGLIVYNPDLHVGGVHPCGFSFAPPNSYSSSLKVYLLGKMPPSHGLTFGPKWIIPATVPLGLSAALIGLSYWRRPPKGHCAKCGYDLTGIADKCPECGAAAKSVKA